MTHWDELLPQAESTCCEHDTSIPDYLLGPNYMDILISIAPQWHLQEPKSSSMRHPPNAAHGHRMDSMVFTLDQHSNIINAMDAKRFAHQQRPFQQFVSGASTRVRPFCSGATKLNYVEKFVFHRVLPTRSSVK